MGYVEYYGQTVTQAYACLIKNEVHLKYPNFYFEKGVILYDYDSESYVYLGYTDEELTIIRDAVHSIQKN